MKPMIPQQEFEQRIIDTQQKMKEQGLELLLCYGNEAEPQFVRYYSDYWPSFESAGVLIPQCGQALLLIGPESGTYAAGVSRIHEIRKLLALRESSEPEYPGARLDTFASVIREAMGGKAPANLGVAGYSLIPHVIFQALEAALQSLGNVELRKADALVAEQRVIKSENELACLREAYRITQAAMGEVIARVRVGMTENQLKGVAMSKIYEEGGEGEAYPFWILTGEGSNQAISRCRNKVIQAGDLIQIQIAARYQGYASTMGRPVVMGRATENQRRMIEAAYDAQRQLLAMMKPGVNAGDVSRRHIEVMRAHGCEDMVLYGPVHGTGLMEGEYPWIESTSDYPLREGMTFCTCLYLGDNPHHIGIRVEDGFLITADGTESFSDERRELIEILP